MGLLFNATMTRVSCSNRFTDLAGKTFTLAKRLNSTSFAARQILMHCRTGADAEGYSIEVTNSTTIKATFRRASVDTVFTGTVGALSAGTSYDIVVVAALTGCTLYVRATAPGSAGFSAVGVAMTDSGTGSGANVSATNAIDFGNRHDGLVPLLGTVRDASLFQGAMSAADIELFGKGYSPLQLTSATLLNHPINVAGTVVDAVQVAAADATIGGSVQVSSEANAWDGPQTDTTADFGYVTANHLCSLSCGSALRPSLAYDSNTTTGNIRAIIDESGNGLQCRQPTAIYRLRFKIDSLDGDRRIASWFCAAAATTSYMPFNTTATAHVVSNRGITIGLVHSANSTNVAAADNLTVKCKVGAGAGISLATDAQGYVCVRVNTGNTTRLLLPSGVGVRAQSKPVAYVLTVSQGAAGNAVFEAHTFTLYTNEGVATATDSYTNNDFGTINFFGPDATSALRGQYGVFKGFDVWKTVFTAAQAQQQLDAYNNRFNLSAARPTGVVLHVGDSLVEGSVADRSSCALALYYLSRMISPRIRVVGQGISNTTVCSHRLTVAAGTVYNAAQYSNPTAFIDGELCNQGAAQCRVAYQNGTLLYVYDWNGVAFDTTGTVPLVGAVSLVSRNVSAALGTAAAASHLFNKRTTADRAAVARDLLNEVTGPKALWLRCATNAVSLTWAPADVVECDKAFTAWIKTNAPTAKVHLCTTIPRTVAGTNGPLMQAYNAAIRLVSGYWDTVVDHSNRTEFDFKDAGLTPDNGLADYSSAAIYQADDTGTVNDNIHVNDAGNLLFAIDGERAFGSSLTINARRTVRARRYKVARTIAR